MTSWYPDSTVLKTTSPLVTPPAGSAPIASPSNVVPSASTRCASRIIPPPGDRFLGQEMGARGWPKNPKTRGGLGKGGGGAGGSSLGDSVEDGGGTVQDRVADL